MGIESLLEKRREYDGFACNYPGQWKSRRGPEEYKGDEHTLPNIRQLS